MYKVGDEIVHPMHGAGVLTELVDKQIDGKNRQYYILKMSASTMTVTFPCDVCGALGVRDIIDMDGADSVIAGLDTITIDENQNWSKRFRENMEKIKSGDLFQVASVIKCLIFRDKARGLSTGERKMLSSAKQILISELMLAKKCEYDDIEKIVVTALG